MLNTLQQRINQHQHLNGLRVKLMHLHKQLLDTECVRYQQAQGKVSKGELLQLVISHDQFAWLRSLSNIILHIDELLHADEPVTEGAIATILNDIRTLLTPDVWGNDFASKYDAAFQHSPDVVLAHADVFALLTTDIQH